MDFIAIDSMLFLSKYRYQKDNKKYVFLIIVSLTLAGSDFSSGCSLKVCEALDMVFLRGVVVPSCEGRTNSILPPSTTILGAGGKFSVLPTVSQ